MLLLNSDIIYLSGGFMVLSKRMGHSIYFLISQRIKSWRDFIDKIRTTLVPLCDNVQKSCLQVDVEESAESMLMCVTKRFSGDVLSMISTYANEFSLNHVSVAHQEQVDLLLEQLRSTAAFGVISRYHNPPTTDDDLPAHEVMTILLLALPRSTWEGDDGFLSPCIKCFFPDSLPEPLNNEVIAIRYQIEALLQYCNYGQCSL
uniref:Uncharacterized protein n=1 Tax=Spongospora subterranea TaxID=70186 RepID=A0A0H5QLD2_9EUKA|eukprot:CRZ02945.1 hypothetical protein [Spongospora subterranea]